MRIMRKFNVVVLKTKALFVLETTDLNKEDKRFRGNKIRLLYKK
jgi:hypothetical protein